MAPNDGPQGREGGVPVKTERLIGILSLLLQQERVTAPELAQRFEVSRRTIQRDIEALSLAGVPLCTTRGPGGGISILEGYRVDRTVLTSGEMQAILAGLRSLDSVSGTRRYARLMEKLSAGSGSLVPGGGHLWIDLSSWYKTSLPPKFETIRTAIEEGRVIQFRYYAPKGESVRQAEPFELIFHWSAWYVWAFCRGRQDFRLFKLNRMEKLTLTDLPFEKRPVPLPDLSCERIFPGGIRVKALFEPSCKWRLVEEFGSGCFAAQPDGRLLFQVDYTDPEELLRWLLTFGDQVELLEPAELRARLAQRLERALNLYRKET